MKEIARKLFLSLNRDNRHHNHYIILLDGTYENEFWADNDTEALQIFRNGEYK